MQKKIDEDEAQQLALKKCGKSIDAWLGNRRAFPELTMNLAQDLHALRSTHVSKTAFGAALKAAGYGEDVLSKNDRAALLKMAEHEELSREVLAKTDRWSPQHIWEQEIKPLLPKAEGEQGQQADDGTNDSGGDPESDEPEAEPMPRDQFDDAVAKLKAHAKFMRSLDIDAFKVTFEQRCPPPERDEKLSAEEQQALDLQTEFDQIKDAVGDISYYAFHLGNSL